MKKKFQVLHEKAVQISKVYLKAESDLIAVLQEIDDCKGFREMSFKSLFEYATQGLGLTESVSYNLITVARKSKEVPKLQERVRFVADERLEVKVGISQSLHEKLKRVQDLVSSQFGQAADLEKTLEALVDLYIEKKDPIEKAKRAEAREEKREIQTHKKIVVQPVPGQVKSQMRYIPAKLEHAILLRDQGRCTYQTRNGERCLERRWLDIHHVQPLSEGGVTALENLKLVCKAHHQLLHHADRMH